MIISETRERFISAIAERLAGADVLEAHFFSPHRHAEIESGLAVIAARGDAQNPERPTVYSATYQLTIKGAARGAWVASVIPEADAPLVTVDEVVRGVARRAADTDEITRMAGDEFRAIVQSRATASA